MNSGGRAALNVREIFFIARDIAGKHHLSCPSHMEMLQAMRGKYSPPIVRKNGNGTIWVDRYYVAYRLYESSEVKYVYMTRYHILEEVYSYKAASKLRDKQVKLPADIQKQFAYALKHMDGNIWTDPEYAVT
ncbi:MAG: hypothetical protein IK019_00275 [Clostridia bacterium]|nr:hypothetical protein [Clostridia bacterium]